MRLFMSLVPSPSSTRGEITLQPAYFTSSAFVHAARADVERLVQDYSRRYARTAPFALFKDIWQGQGWTWIQFKVFDTRSRAAFFKVMMRLFLERVGAGQPPLGRAAALFGVYTMYHTQPSTSAPSLYSAGRVELACDHYQEMLALPDALEGEHLLPVRPHVIYVLSDLLQAQVFHVLPHAETHPLSPRALPRAVVEDDEVTGEGRKRGRPSKHERVKKAKGCVAALEEGWAGESGDATGYMEARSALLDAVRSDSGLAAAVRAAKGAVVDRIGMIKYTSGACPSSSMLQ